MVVIQTGLMQPVLQLVERELALEQGPVLIQHQHTAEKIVLNTVLTQRQQYHHVILDQ
jgi:hypothetical protein